MRDCEEFRADMRDDFTCVYNFSMTNVYVLVYYIYEKIAFREVSYIHAFITKTLYMKKIK